jgi:hypothetical protein
MLSNESINVIAKARGGFETALLSRLERSIQVIRHTPDGPANVRRPVRLVSPTYKKDISELRAYWPIDFSELLYDSVIPALEEELKRHGDSLGVEDWLFRLDNCDLWVGEADGFFEFFGDVEGRYILVPDGKQIGMSDQAPPRLEGYRRLTHHAVNGLNEQIMIDVLDNPGHGGACHHYRITTVGEHSNRPEECCFADTEIRFQNGPIKEHGVNGISNEALLAILIDRLEGFQSGKFACHDNQVALDHLQSARLWLHKRTMDRVARGVEGKSAV